MLATPQSTTLTSQQKTQLTTTTSQQKSRWATSLGWVWVEREKIKEGGGGGGGIRHREKQSTSRTYTQPSLPPRAFISIGHREEKAGGRREAVCVWGGTHSIISCIPVAIRPFTHVLLQFRDGARRVVHRPLRHRVHQARSAVRWSASRMEGGGAGGGCSSSRKLSHGTPGTHQHRDDNRLTKKTWLAFKLS